MSLTELSSSNKKAKTALFLGDPFDLTILHTI